MLLASTQAAHSPSLAFGVAQGVRSPREEVVRGRRVVTGWFGALAHSVERQLRKASSFEKEQESQLIEAYARGHNKHR